MLLGAGNTAPELPTEVTFAYQGDGPDADPRSGLNGLPMVFDRPGPKPWSDQERYRPERVILRPLRGSPCLGRTVPAGGGDRRRRWGGAIRQRDRNGRPPQPSSPRVAEAGAAPLLRDAFLKGETLRQRIGRADHCGSKTRSRSPSRSPTFGSFPAVAPSRVVRAWAGRGDRDAAATGERQPYSSPLRASASRAAARPSDRPASPSNV